MATLLLARHGETDWNRDARFQGHSDTPLNERGRAQARALAATIPPVDRVYASDLARARETAAIIAERLGVGVKLDPRLRERRFGAWEGLTAAEIAERFEAQYARWLAGDAPGADDAESAAEFAARVGSFVDDVLERHAREDILVVAHGGTIRVIHALATGVDYVANRRSIPPVENCILTRYALKGGKLAPID